MKNIINPIIRMLNISIISQIWEVNATLLLDPVTMLPRARPTNNPDNVKISSNWNLFGPGFESNCQNNNKNINPTKIDTLLKVAIIAYSKAFF